MTSNLTSSEDRGERKKHAYVDLPAGVDSMAMQIDGAPAGRIAVSVQCYDKERLSAYKLAVAETRRST